MLNDMKDFCCLDLKCSVMFYFKSVVAVQLGYKCYRNMYEGDKITKHFHTITYCFFISLLTLTWVDFLGVCFEVGGM